MDQEANKFAHLFSFSGVNKAGMGNIDKERQAKTVYEISKNSAYFKQAAKQDETAILKAKL